MLELVVKQGVHATPMSQVARESNVAIGTIYYYFKDKEDILCHIYKMIRKDFGSILIIKSENTNPELIFKKYWKDLYHYYISNPVAFHFYEHVAKPPIIPLDLVEETKTYYRKHAAFFWNGVKSGILKNIHVTLLVQLAYSNVVAAVDLKLNGVLPMTDAQINEAANASWDAVRHIEK
ncbi:TetR/AcrR family transcriptional regulator [Lacinutrix cladophorae]